jgi:hypothetical protein
MTARMAPRPRNSEWTVRAMNRPSTSSSDTDATVNTSVTQMLRIQVRSSALTAIAGRGR